MNEADIRNYAKLMQELGLTGLEITEKDKMVRLERTLPAPAKETVYVDAYEHSSAREPEAAAPVSQPVNCVSVKSPIVGVFYAAPAENAAPYVSIGDQVKKGQTLCIVEAMKLMNEIVAEEDGVISEICVTNSQVVEYGTELFRIRR